MASLNRRLKSPDTVSHRKSAVIHCKIHNRQERQILKGFHRRVGHGEGWEREGEGGCWEWVKGKAHGSTLPLAITLVWVNLDFFVYIHV